MPRMSSSSAMFEARAKQEMQYDDVLENGSLLSKRMMPETPEKEFG